MRESKKDKGIAEKVAGGAGAAVTAAGTGAGAAAITSGLAAIASILLKYL